MRAGSGERASGTGLGGDDDVDAASLGIAAAGRQGLGLGDRDLDRLAAGVEPRPAEVAVAGARPELACEDIGPRRDARRRRAADRLLRRRERSRRRKPLRDAADLEQPRCIGRTQWPSRQELVTRNDHAAKGAELALEIGAIPAGDGGGQRGARQRHGGEPDRAGAPAHVAPRRSSVRVGLPASAVSATLSGKSASGSSRTATQPPAGR